uniref:SET domain-containing protein n=1 Tax=Glossina brevipalpis TaxID=37001 RepID=A0A1A9WTW7_9MUSC
MYSVYTETYQDEEYEQLKDYYDSIIINQCDCSTENCDNINCKHGNNYVRDVQSQELVLNPKNTRELIYECTSLCACKEERCLNRLVQYGPRNNLKIIYSKKYQSNGLITTEIIPKGAFICEYAGELLTIKQAQERIQENDNKQKMNYILSLCESVSHDDIVEENKIILTIVDPDRKGNIGRYLNHSCQPNCEIKSVRINCPIPKIAIFSKDIIKAGEELCFHYNEGVKRKTNHAVKSRKRIPCLCDAKNCEKYLPSECHGRRFLVTVHKFSDRDENRVN